MSSLCRHSIAGPRLSTSAARLLLQVGVALLVLLAVGTKSVQAAKLALLVGISKYENNPTPLAGVIKDVSLMKKMLTTKFGFNDQNGDIEILGGSDSNQRVTKPEVIAALDRLIQRSSALGTKDTIFIYFSSHGDVRSDVSGTNDSGVMIRDLQMIITSEGHPNGELPDKQINFYLNQLRSRQHNVTFVVDACNAGGLDRGPNSTKHYTRGNFHRRAPTLPGRSAASSAEETPSVVLASPSVPTPPTGPWAEGLELWQRRSRRGPQQGRLDCFYAAKSGQNAVPTPQGGLFTQAFASAVRTGITCEELAVAINKAIELERSRTAQEPVADPENPKLTFLGADRALPIPSLTSINGRTGEINVGSINQVKPGTVVGLYEPSPPLTLRDLNAPPRDSRLKLLGVVESTTAFTSKVTFDSAKANKMLVKPIPISNANYRPRPNMPVMILARSYGEFRVPVWLDGVPKDSRLARLVAKSPLVLPVFTGADYRIRLKQTAEHWELISWQTGETATVAGSKVMWRIASGAGDSDVTERQRVLEGLEACAQAWNLLNVKNWDKNFSDLGFDIHVLAAPTAPDGTVGKFSSAFKNSSGVYIFKLHDRVRVDLRAKNPQLSRKFKFGLLNITDYGEVKYLAPKEGVDQLFESSTKSSGEIPAENITDGTEAVQLFAITGNATNLNFKLLEQDAQGFIDQRSATGPKIPFPRNSPLLQLFHLAMRGKRSREQALPVPPMTWGTKSFRYRIVYR